MAPGDDGSTFFSQKRNPLRSLSRKRSIWVLLGMVSFLSVCWSTHRVLLGSYLGTPSIKMACTSCNTGKGICDRRPHCTPPHFIEEDMRRPEPFPESHHLGVSGMRSTQWQAQGSWAHKVSTPYRPPSASLTKAPFTRGDRGRQILYKFQDKIIHNLRSVAEVKPSRQVITRTNCWQLSLKERWVVVQRAGQNGWKNPKSKSLISILKNKPAHLQPLHPGHFRRLVVWAVANIWKPDLLANRTGKFTTPSPVPQGAARCMCGSIQDPATLPQIFCFWYVHSQHLRPFQDSSSSTNFFTTSNSSRPMTRGKGVQGSLCPQHTSDRKSEDSVKSIKSNTMKYKAQFDRFHDFMEALWNGESWKYWSQFRLLNLTSA